MATSWSADRKQEEGLGGGNGKGEKNDNKMREKYLGGRGGRWRKKWGNIRLGAMV